MSNLTLVLSEVSQGKVKRDAEQQFADLVAAISKHGGAGTIVIKLKLRQMSEGTVAVTGDVSTSPPRPKLMPSIFFTTDDNLLSRTDPNQSELPLKVVEGGKPEEQQQRKEATA